MKPTTSSFRQRSTRLLTLLAAAAMAVTATHGMRAEAASTTTSQLIGSVEAFLEQAAVEYLLSGNIDGRHEITVNNLDSRLKLPLCDQSLSVRLESPAQPIGRVTTRVRCDGATPWTLFVPAQVRLFRPILITTRPLSRTSVVGPEDVSLVERDIGQLPQGYLTAPEQAIGKKLTRQVNSQQALSPNHLQASKVINKGDRVVITARSGAVKVHMPGEALSDGAHGEQIQVRNTRSQRTIRARVVSHGQVEVAM